MTLALPYLISLLIGYFFITLLARGKEKIPFLLGIFLAMGMGLGVSSQIMFYSFVIFDTLNRIFVILSHCLLLSALLGAIIFSFRNDRGLFNPMKENIALDKTEVLFLLLFLVICIPSFLQAQIYPYGGWDAWSTWNLKSKFLFLGEKWKNIFDPLLWRASPHYPLLLPLVNAWGWIFPTNPTHMIPLMTSLIFTVITAGLLFSGLKIFIKNLPALLGVFLMLSLLYFVQLATDQYSDIVLAYFLLGSLLCLFLAKVKRVKNPALLSGLCLGFLSFTKPEGTTASLLIVPLGIIYLLWKEPHQDFRRRAVMYFLAGLFISALPAMIFYGFCAPPNQTFTNGLISSSHPAHWDRLQVIFLFFWFEIVNKKWGYLWIILFGGFLLGWKRCLHRQMMIFPVFLIFYGAAVGSYYFVNTYFEIRWWLSVTLNRILFAVLPIVIFWIFSSLWQKKNSSFQ